MRRSPSSRVGRATGAVLALLVGVGAPPLGAQSAPLPPGTPPPAAGPCEGTAPRRDAWSTPDPEALFDQMRRDLAELGAGGAAVRLRRPMGWLGLQTVEVRDLRVTAAGRVVRYCTYPAVVAVEPESPADRAGIAPGDTLVAYAGQDLLRGGEVWLDRLLVPGRTLPVTLRRDGRTVVRPVVVGTRAPAAMAWSGVGVGREGSVTVHGGAGDVRVERRLRVDAPDGSVSVTFVPAPPAPPAGPPPPASAPRAPRPALPPVPVAFGPVGPAVVAGAQVVAMDDDLRDALRAPAGVLVVKVLPGTPAAAAGLRAGDVVAAAGGEAVATPGTLHRALMRAAGERALALQIERRGKRRSVELRW